MNTFMASAQHLAQDLRDALRRRNAARAARRALEQELSSYRTPGEVNDLLGSIAYEESAEAEQIREIVLGNLAARGA
ncbi:MAG TPA: hypothetical protein VF635_02350 [Propionibacteriaceae bacterium]|jgi:hypothetical protein